MTLPALSTYGSDGITLARYADILARLVAEMQTKWGESVDTSEDEYLGHQIRLISTITAEINEIVQYIYNGGAVQNSSGVMLDNNVALIGLKRQTDSSSTVRLKITCVKALTVPAGSLYKTEANVIFATDEEAIAAGAGDIYVDATCTVVGEYNAAIGQVNTIVTSIGGVTAVTNEAAATPGRTRQTDAELKELHTLAVATSGENDAASIYEALNLVDGVSGILVEDNDTDHYIHVSVIGGEDEDIAKAISYNKTASVPLVGSTTYDLYDEITSQQKTIRWDTASNYQLHIDVHITKVNGIYPDDGDQQIKDNLVAHFDKYDIGDDVIYNSLYGPIFAVPGLNVSLIEIDQYPNPAGTSDIPISTTQRAWTYDGIIRVIEV